MKILRRLLIIFASIYIFLIGFIVVKDVLHAEDRGKPRVEAPVEAKKTYSDTGIIKYSKISEVNPTKEKTLEKKSVSLVFAGDIIPHGSVLKSATYENGYDFTKSMMYVSDIIKSKDLAIINLETPIVRDKKTSGYPMFNGPVEIITGLKQTGFDILNTNNNHTFDKRRDGALKTISEIKNAGLIQLGGRDSGKNFRIVEKNGLKIAFSSYTHSYNGMDATLDKNDPLISFFNYENAKKDIKEMEREKPDFKVCFIHWGDEYKTSPNDTQKKTATFLSKVGYDLVVGSHPHVLQPYEEIKNGDKKTVVVYSLGNFLSGQRREKLGTTLTEDGLLFSCQLVKNGDETDVENCEYIPLWVCDFKEGKNARFIVIPCEKFLKGELNVKLPDNKKKEVNDSLYRSNTILKTKVR